MSLHKLMMWIIRLEPDKFFSENQIPGWTVRPPGSQPDTVERRWTAPLISQFQMTHDNHVIKMSPFSTSDTLLLSLHLNNKSAVECRLPKKRRKAAKTDLLFIPRLTSSLYFGVKAVRNLEGRKAPVKSSSACVKVAGFLNSSPRTG